MLTDATVPAASPLKTALDLRAEITPLARRIIPPGDNRRQRRPKACRDQHRPPTFVFGFYDRATRASLGGRFPCTVRRLSEERFALNTSRLTQIRLPLKRKEANGAMKNLCGLAQWAGFYARAGISSRLSFYNIVIRTLGIRTDREPGHSTPHGKSKAAETA
jgi:hypothetical protein